MKRYKRWSLTVLTMSMSLLSLLVLLNYAVDPLQFYRKAWYPASFSTQQRYQIRVWRNITTMTRLLSAHP